MATFPLAQILILSSTHHWRIICFTSDCVPGSEGFNSYTCVEHGPTLPYHYPLHSTTCNHICIALQEVLQVIQRMGPGYVQILHHFYMNNFWYPSEGVLESISSTFQGTTVSLSLLLNILSKLFNITKPIFPTLRWENIAAFPQCCDGIERYRSCQTLDKARGSREVLKIHWQC